ncbi:GNAT family N-acetyltransferase [Dyadobacter sp. CY312]|uniref:GNAT family N-acetyltransferase n=1 Tax=Dyadobacter sp. CY312 TaxID=2907303 RepID=UPI001F21A1F1|nr:GNAT family N-acetyltransferase [Dyadobacter sp. CY312]MCE7041823.1 GNAT family N-acetyltransferase [Dyadobacter sp. CY312]
MAFTYRTATIADIPQLKQLGLDSYGTFQNVLTEDNWAKLHSNLRNETVYTDLLNKSTCYVCVYDEQIVGMAFFIPNGNPTEIYDAGWSYVRMVGVHPDFGGRGIGRELMQTCIAVAKETNEKVVALHTSEFMDAARYIYESMGFVKVKDLESRFGKRYWLYRLEI